MANETAPKATAQVKYRLKGGKTQHMLPNVSGIVINNDNLNSDPRLVNILKKRGLFDTLVEVAQ